MLWYPYSQMKTMKKPIKIVNAKGIKLYTSEDEELIDSIASWWAVIHGYNNNEINDALKSQIDSFAHVMLGGLTHDPALMLSEKIAELLPEDLDYVFFSDSGSVAVEVALKMAIQYYYNNGLTNKTDFISLTNSYHGDTFKTMQLGDDEDYHLAFPNKDGVHHINPDLDELENILKEKSDSVAAFVVEPLLQGGGGMQLYDVAFLEKAKQLCHDYNVLLIFDEVATGFGRTGNMFVSNLVAPDIVVLGKALTCGYMGHAATVANKKVYDAFYDDDPTKALMHGPTFMGNPLACTVALKNIEIFQREDYLSKIKNINKILNEEFTQIKSEQIKDIRVLGAMGCIEVYDNKYIKEFSDFARKNGVWNRPFLNYVYIMPAYIITEEELKKVIYVFKKWFEEEVPKFN